jgi:short-subunit dehydrogenase
MFQLIFVKNTETLKPNKVVLITGASSGIGLALSKLFVSEGYRVCLAARSFEKLVEIQRDINPEKDRTHIVKTDVSLPVECEQLVKQTVSFFGGIDILIHSAGITMRALFGQVDLSVLHKIMDVNFWGTVYCTHYAMPELLKSKGTVVGISSVAGYKGLPTRSGYSASKFALEGFLETLRIENLKTGVHVLIARPGFTATNIRNTMMDGYGQEQGISHKDEAHSLLPERVAIGIFKAIKNRKAYLLMGSTAKLTFWLNKWFSNWVDKQVYKHVAAEKDSPLKP